MHSSFSCNEHLSTDSFYWQTSSILLCLELSFPVLHPLSLAPSDVTSPSACGPVNRKDVLAAMCQCHVSQLYKAVPLAAWSSSETLCQTVVTCTCRLVKLCCYIALFRLWIAAVVCSVGMCFVTFAIDVMFMAHCSWFAGVVSCAGYPFSSYGEVVACWLQDVVIVGLIVRFKCVHLPSNHRI